MSDSKTTSGPLSHASSLVLVAHSPDASLVACSVGDKVRVFDRKTNTIVWTANATEITSVNSNPASAAEHAKTLLSNVRHSAVRVLVFDAKGEYLIMAVEDKKLRLIRVADWTCTVER
jgi:WD40 repeat protein